MTRRDAAWLIAKAAAAAGGAEFFAGWTAAAVMAPPEPERWNAYRPAFFSAPQYADLMRFTEILIPSDETPGAKEAHVAPFTDFVVAAAAEYAPEMQTEWRRAMQWLSAHNFAGLAPAAQEALVGEMARPERNPAERHDGYAAYRLIKEMTVHAFYTSRAGLIETLEYQGNAYLTAFPPCNHPEHHKV